MTGPAFGAYVEQFLTPLAPGAVVVLDDLAARKVTGVRQARAAAGASLLYLPPYAPDLNPIEQLFAKLKALLRKAAARTKHELWQALGRLLAAVPPSECPRCLHHCDYRSIQNENALGALAPPRLIVRAKSGSSLSARATEVAERTLAKLEDA